MNTNANGKVPFDRAEAYRQAGWSGTLALPARKKKPPPEGFTGNGGGWPGPEDLASWRAQGLENIALRPPPMVIGLDVDCYDGKLGKETFLALCERWGAPQRTWYSTARRDGSGIRWFRVPHEVRDLWPTEAGPGIEIVRFGHRYGVAPPSIHEDTGERYRWVRPDGTDASDGEIPTFGDLAELPARWVEGLTGVQANGKRDPGHVRPGSRAELRENRERASDWFAELEDGEPCSCIGQTAADALAAARREDGNAYDHTRDAVLAL
ncbi:MAG: hypothetical protein GEU90_21760 [Gemmatimonas sp.]|nr:hypothetical protein [Gemmatimonas sp.]